jgi:DNA polymerase phi
VTCSQIISLIVDASKPQGSITGQEERDLLFARLFGLTAVIRSGLIARSSSLSTSASSAPLVSTPESFKEIITNLIAIGEKKSWLRESAGWTILLAIEQVEGSTVDWKDDAVESLVELNFVESKAWSPEKLAIAMKLQQMRPKRNWKAAFAPTFKNPDLLATGNLLNVARILKVRSSILKLWPRLNVPLGIRV